MAPSDGVSDGIFTTPPTLRHSNQYPIIFDPAYKLLCLLFTLFCLLFLIFTSPIILILRLVAKFPISRIPLVNYTQRVCRSTWSILGSVPDVALLISDQAVECNYLNNMLMKFSLNDSLKGGPNNLAANKTEICRQCNESDRILVHDGDLRNLVNDASCFPVDTTSVRQTASIYSQQLGQSCYVLLVSIPTYIKEVCSIRLIAALTDLKLVFELHPSSAYRSVSNRLPERCWAFISRWCNLIIFGPMSIASLIFKRRNSLWRYLSGNDEANTTKKRRVGRLENRESSSVLMESIPDDVLITTPKENHSQKSNDEQKPGGIPHHRHTWLSLPHADMVLRAERLLRTTSAEMMISLVAGTLRRYCRSQGLMHPPDLGFLITSSNVPCHTSASCDCQCDTVLVPLTLPTGVEGAIPRLWATQKRLITAFNSHIPDSMRFTDSFVRQCLPASTATSFCRFLFRSYNIHIAFYRTNDDVKLSEGNPLRGSLLFPSLSPLIKASFTFIQHGKGTDICISLCKKTFPDATVIKSLFEVEVVSFLDHLSIRLLSLPQTTYLPDQIKESTLDDEQIFGSIYMMQKTRGGSTAYRSDSVATVLSEEDYSMDELLRLLATVQNELDVMRANPEGDRSDYIRKLTELEERMQRFHNCIVERLGKDMVPDMENDEVLDYILAPYKGGSEERRFSREFIRTDEIPNIRKASRSSI